MDIRSQAVASTKIPHKITKIKVKLQMFAGQHSFDNIRVVVDRKSILETMTMKDID